GSRLRAWRGCWRRAVFSLSAVGVVVIPWWLAGRVVLVWGAQRRRGEIRACDGYPEEEPHLRRWAQDTVVARLPGRNRAGAPQHGPAVVASALGVVHACLLSPPRDVPALCWRGGLRWHHGRDGIGRCGIAWGCGRCRALWHDRG